METRRWTGRFSALALGIGAFSASPAAAQYIEPGVSRVVMTDVSGAAVTSGDQLAGIYAPGTVPTFSCPAALGVRTVAESLITDLGSGGIRISLPGDAIPAGTSTQVRTRLLELLTDADADEAENWLEAALVVPGNDSRGARRAASRLASNLKGLLANTRDMNPDYPGYRPAQQLIKVVASFNGVLDESSAAFLASPSEEFLAVRAVLSRLVVASLDNEGVRSSAAAQGSSCAVSALTRTVPVPQPVPSSTLPPPADTAIEICVLVDGAPTYVGAIVEGTSLDTMVVRDGIRRPVGEVFPETTSYAGSNEWYRQGESLVINGVTYAPWGVSFTPRDRAFRRSGAYQGVPVLSEQGGTGTSTIVYLPVSSGCRLQEYRAQETIRGARG